MTLMPTRLKKGLSVPYANPIARVLAIPPPIPKKNAGVRKVPTRIVPRNTRNIVTINPTLNPYRTMAVKAMILAKPNRNQGRGEGINISALWTTTDIATRDETMAFRFTLPKTYYPKKPVSP
jgi:hypothetical protein